MSLLSEKYEKIIGVGFSFPFHFSGNGGVAKQGNNGFDSSIEKIRESVVNIDIINRNENSGLVEINVDFVVRQTNQSGNIVYPFYLNRNQ